jgi:hypothetical protein
MAISVTTNNEQITAAVTDEKVTATVSPASAVSATVTAGFGATGPAGAPGASTWNDITGKPATFPPETHTHALSALTQSSATSGQVVTWSGSAWTAADTAAPATLDGNGSGVPSLLLHCDGANGGTTFTDSSANALTVTANGVTTSTTQSKFGGAAAYFNDSHLEITDGNGSPVEALSLGTGQFSVDFWVYVTGGSTYKNILEFGTTSDYPATRFGLTIYPSGLLRVENFAALVEDATAFPTSQWVHVAVTRDSANTMRLFRNGAVVGSATVSQSFTANMARVGKQWDGNHFVGWLDELRVVKGEALFTTTFTPATAAYSLGAAGTTMRQRRGTASSFSGVTLAAGQIAFETDTGKLKVGDGVTVYSSLDYVGGSGGSSAWEDITGKPSFATVATSGAYADLSGLPTLFDGAYASLTSVPSTFAPSAHKSSHSTGGADALTAADIGAAASSHAHGNITSVGAIGSTSGQIVVTTTAGALTTAASISTSQVSGLGSLATQSGTFSGTSSGTNTGDQTITLTGDVTGSGTGSFAATLSSTGVSAGTYTSVTVDAKGRVTAGSSPAVAYSSLSGVPSTFAPSSHTHSLSDLSQSGATTNQVPQWNGSAWVPATVSGGGGSSSASDLVSGTLNDARLSAKSQSAMNVYLWSNFR